MSCPKCGASMILKEDCMVCVRETCGYREPIKVPSLAEVAEENRELRLLLILCQKYLEDVIEYVKEDEHIIAKEGEKLLKKIKEANGQR